MQRVKRAHNNGCQCMKHRRHPSERLVMDRLGRRYNRQAEPVEEVWPNRAWWFGWAISVGLILWLIIAAGVAPRVADFIRALP